MTAEDIFDRVAADLGRLGARAGVMFGKRALVVGSKAFACLKGEQLAFRLGAGTPEHEKALGLPGAALFDPAGTGRPFKDWVAVPVAESARWAQLAEDALAATRA